MLGSPDRQPHIAENAFTSDGDFNIKDTAGKSRMFS